MKIQLPNQPHLFEKGLKTSIKTARSSKSGISFLAHYIGLIQALRHHSITASWINELEAEGQKREKAFNKEAIDALEEEWHFLWTKYPQSGCRKELIRIKHMLTKNIDFFAQTPFDRICYSLSEFKRKFECSEVSEKFSKFSNYNERFRKDRKLHREYIQTSVEIDPVYFWSRLCLLERISQFSSDKFEVPKSPIQGKWKEKKYLHWERATNSSLQAILDLAQGDLLARFDEDGFVNETQELSWPIDETFKFTRRACDRYFDHLLIHIRPILLKAEETENRNKASSEVILSKTLPQQKKDELVKHTKKYWDKFPTASYEQVYDYYCDRCRFNPYSRSEWERKVRKLMLDPRPSKEKVRGFSEKGALKK